MQKTAYEMRISDWSSDVCSSDLQELIGQAADLRRHGGREEQRLADLRQQADNALDVGHEAHVEHAVGLVDHQDLHVGEQDLAALEEVDESTRRGDQHVDAALQIGRASCRESVCQYG